MKGLVSLTVEDARVLSAAAQMAMARGGLAQHEVERIGRSIGRTLESIREASQPTPTQMLDELVRLIEQAGYDEYIPSRVRYAAVDARRALEQGEI